MSRIKMENCNPQIALKDIEEKKSTIHDLFGIM